MSTSTVTELTSADEIMEIAIDTVEQDLFRAAAMIRSAAIALTNAYGDGTPAYDTACHRFALTNKLSDSLTTVQKLIDKTQKVTTSTILSAHTHGEDFEIEGSTWHRYDETRANGVSYSELYAKAKGFLSGAQLGACNRLEKVQKSGVKTYHRLKPGNFKGKN